MCWMRRMVSPIRHALSLLAGLEQYNLRRGKIETITEALSYDVEAETEGRGTSASSSIYGMSGQFFLEPDGIAKSAAVTLSHLNTSWFMGCMLSEPGLRSASRPLLFPLAAAGAAA